MSQGMSQTAPEPVYSGLRQETSTDASRNLEYPMLLQRPATVKCQDINHVLTSALRDVLGKDKICKQMMQNLVTSKGSKDPYHEQYVDLLSQVCKERDKRTANITMLERHLMQVQARVVSADERKLNSLKSYRGDEELLIPKGDSCYRAYINSSMLRDNDLIVPQDYVTEEKSQHTSHIFCYTSTNLLQTKLSAQLLGNETGKNDPSYLQTTTARLNYHSEKKKLFADVFSRKTFIPAPDNRMKLSTPDLYLPNLKRSEYSVDKAEMSTSKKISLKEAIKHYNGKVSEKDLPVQMTAQVNFLQNPRYTLQELKSKPRLLTEPVKDKSGDDESCNVKNTPETPFFLPYPPQILFSEYKIGQIYEAKLELKNISTVLRPCRVIPPVTKYFVVGLGQFPNGQGLVAPGMSCLYTIRFAPDTLGTFKDELRVVTQSSAHIVVPLVARRPHPILSLPPLLDIGFCLIDGKLITHVVIKNFGGSGCFCMIPAEIWNSSTCKESIYDEYIKMPPFTVGPATFELKEGFSGVFEVIFEPQVVGKYRHRVALICDNCEVKYFTIIGTCQQAKVMLVDHTTLCSQPLPNESFDSSANHLLRFDDINCFSNEKKIITIKNCTNIDLPFFWLPVKPDFQNSDSNSKKPTDRDSVFHLTPNVGLLKPDATMEFKIIFAPEKIGSYDCVFHMILKEPPSMDRSDINNRSAINRRRSLQLLKNIEIEFQSQLSYTLPAEPSTFKLAMKGKCVPFNILIYPYALFLPVPILFLSTEYRDVQVINNSVNSIKFHWQCEDDDLYTIKMQPSEGTINVGEKEICKLSLIGYKPVTINLSLKCYIEYQEQPLYFPLQATIKGPEVVIVNSDIDFGLVCIGDCVIENLVLRNKSPIKAKFHISQIPKPIMNSVDFSMSLTEGTLEPYQTLQITISFAPVSIYSLTSHLIVEVEDGQTSIVAVCGNVQVPQVVLESCELDMGCVSCGIETVFTVALVNISFVETQFEWFEHFGSQADQCKIKIEPDRGLICARQKANFNLTFLSKEQMVFDDVFICCKVMEMIDPLWLAIKAHVKGLIVEYHVSKDSNFINESEDNSEPVILDFEDVKLDSMPSMYLQIKNTTPIESTYSIFAENFPVDCSIFQPSKKGQRMNSKLPMPLSNPSATFASFGSRAERSQTLINGAGIFIEPPRGKLPPLGHVIVKVTLVSSMWGNYRDNLLCQTGELDIVRVPVVFNIVGNPLRFLIVGPANDHGPKLRFGFSIPDEAPLQRNVKIYNTSVFDIRIDWSVYNVYQNDDRVVDLNIYYNGSFPSLAPNNRENVVTDEDINASDSSKCLESSPDKLREKIIKVVCTPHNGVCSDDPFLISPKQMIIRGNSDACVTVTFTPPSVKIVQDRYRCISYAAGYLNLDPEQQKISLQKGIQRQEGWHKTPLQIYMTADVLPAKLTVEFSIEGDIFMEGTLGEVFLGIEKTEVIFKSYMIKLLNEMPTTVSFELALSQPFCFFNADYYSLVETSTSSQFTLPPRNAMFVKIGFRMDKLLLQYYQQNGKQDEVIGVRNDPGKMKISVEELHGLKWLYFRHFLKILFTNTSVQAIPLTARVGLPDVQLSTESINFETCWIGQHRYKDFYITNISLSKSFYKISLDIVCPCCNSSVFVVQPMEIALDERAFQSSNFKRTITVIFKPEKVGNHRCLLSIHGQLGEKPKTVDIIGMASSDEKYLVLNEKEDEIGRKDDKKEVRIV